MKSNLKKYCINENDTITTAIEKFQFIHPNRDLLVVKKDKVIGALSEGDVLRSILDGTQLFYSIKKIYNRNFKYLTKYDRKKAIQYFHRYNFHLIPIVSKSFKLINVVTIRSTISLNEFIK